MSDPVLKSRFAPSHSLVERDDEVGIATRGGNFLNDAMIGFGLICCVHAACLLLCLLVNPSPQIAFLLVPVALPLVRAAQVLAC